MRVEVQNNKSKQQGATRRNLVLDFVRLAINCRIYLSLFALGQLCLTYTKENGIPCVGVYIWYGGWGKEDKEHNRSLLTVSLDGFHTHPIVLHSHYRG